MSLSVIRLMWPLRTWKRSRQRAQLLVERETRHPQLHEQGEKDPERIICIYLAAIAPDISASNTLILAPECQGSKQASLAKHAAQTWIYPNALQRTGVTQASCKAPK